MFLLPSQLREIAALPAVRFAETPFPLLLVAHHAAGSSGLLVARRGPIEKRVVLEHGVPVECRSNLAHETFSRFLAAIGRLTDEEANATLSRALARGVLLGEVLVEDGRMDATELQRLLQQSLARKLFDLFTWRDGEITFESGQFTTPAALKVKVARLVLTGIERFMPQETIDAAIGPHAGALLTLHPDVEALAFELRPTARERDLLAALETPRRLEELLPIAAVPLEELSRQLWGLALLGLVIPADRLSSLARSAAIAPPPPAAAPPGAEPAPHAPSPPPLAPTAPSPQPVPTAQPAPISPTPPTSPIPSIAPTSEIDLPTPFLPGFAAATPPDHSRAEAERIRHEVAIAFGQMRAQDAFDLLAAADARSVDELRACYFAFARRFAPWQFAAPELQSAAPAAEELFAAGAIAFARLSDAKACEALRSARLKRAEAAPPAVPVPAAIPATLPDPTAPLSPAGAPRRSDGPQPASFRIETDLLDPELQYKKGRALKEAKRWGPALQQFDFAADCDPQNGAYRAEAAHCRFLLAPSSSSSRALDELKEAQRIDPDSITPYLYAGEVAAHLGRFDEAETYLRSAAKRLGPADRRALDALRDLAKRRKK